MIIEFLRWGGATILVYEAVGRVLDHSPALHTEAAKHTTILMFVCAVAWMAFFEWLSPIQSD